MAKFKPKGQQKRPSLTPNDIRNYQFKGALFGGYNKNQVEEFKELVAREMERLRKQITELENELAQAKLQLLDLDELKEQLEQKSDEVELLKQQNEILERKLKECEQRASGTNEYKVAFESLSREYNALKEEFVALSQRVKELEAENERLKAEAQRPTVDTEEVERLKRALADLKRENEELKGKLKECSATTPTEVLRIAKATADKIKEDAERTRKETLTATLNVLKEMMASLEGIVRDLESKIGG